ncbi:G patch domain-containing protein 3 [Parasteatoda tepidariorum]|uniref:G patch domain-containing protein 3 n=1 Tax=Parasteatoda tepidariorum TaxID=114398 RepID=UPI00077F8B6B|nr:G patch domain-containing protein 3 [Parasteatoda tepidariorum]
MTPMNSEGEYLIVNNIPKTYHASHLRNFYSSFVESGGFLCFHFRHRPEVQKPSNDSNTTDPDRSRRITNCCIIKVLSERVDEFIKQYNGEHWLDDKGETLMTCCFIKKVVFSKNTESTVTSSSAFSKQGTVASNLPLEKETITVEDVESLIEMHPPKCMPHGNVGTKTSHFLKEIQACRLPPSLIAKLDLQFPRNRSKRIYGNVPYEYKKRKQFYERKSTVPAKEELKTENSHKRSWCNRAPVESPWQNDSNSEESESEEEEWDRHEALHEDVTGQERNKERLFEEKIELKWEKGGSGLVFYTDAQYWDEKEGDFDAKTSDDWDIDTRVYTNPGPDNDKDMRDFVRMRFEEKLRDGSISEKDIRYDFAAFEKYSKGFGRKIMESQGWKQGHGIGKNAGITEPLPNEGQLPADKKGFGYRGVKLDMAPKKKKRRCRSKYTDESESEHYHISTIYDNPRISDPPESVLVSSAFSSLKYRQNFLKEESKDS